MAMSPSTRKQRDPYTAPSAPVYFMLIPFLLTHNGIEMLPQLKVKCPLIKFLTGLWTDTYSLLRREAFIGVLLTWQAVSAED